MDNKVHLNTSYTYSQEQYYMHGHWLEKPHQMNIQHGIFAFFISS